MNLNIVKKAFSLTELLIVLVIVAVLFAAMAPIATKRFNGSGPTMDSVWKYTDGNQHDAYYDSESPSLSSVAFVGIRPRNVKSLNSVEKNQSKVVLKAVDGQDMIHFRYGEADGLYAGSFSMDNSGNIKSSDTRNSLGEMNTIAGSGSFDKQSNAKRTVAIGARSLAGQASNADTVAVGVNAGEYIMAGQGRNTFVGANAGRAKGDIAKPLVDNIAIGSNVLNSENSKSSRNVLAGANVASVLFNTSPISSDNVILGASTFVVENAQNNTVIGSGAFPGAKDNIRSLTSVGNNSCAAVKGSPSDEAYSTCIGYNSGAGSADLSKFDTKGEHIYLGGTPKGFGGRSVLEVHNFSTSSTTGYTSRSALALSPTVVLNSNLVVRGNTFFANAAGKLSTHSLSAITDRKSGTEKGADKCCRKLFRSKKWNTSSCGIWGIIIGAIVGLVSIAGILTGIGAAVGVIIAGSIAGGGGGGVVGSLFGGSGYDRSKDILSFSSLNYYYGDNKSYAPACHDLRTENYPDPSFKDNNAAHYRYKNACPDLGIGKGFSDIRLKENITENTDAIEKLLLIMPYHYTYKADKNNTPQVGVIAQDLQKYLPISVSTDEKGFLQIRDDEIFYVTINSINTLNNKLASLVVDETSMEEDTSKIAKSHKSIQKRIDSLNKRADKLDKE